MKKKEKSAGGGANWMDTYGDMVTLLLCFFVLLYSISSVDENKWMALVKSFNPDASPTAQEESGSPGPADVDHEGMSVEETEAVIAQQEEIDESIEQLYQALVEYAEQNQQGSRIETTRGDGYVFISFDDAVFFAGEQYELLPQGEQILKDICAMFDSVESAIDEIRIMGHTAQARPDRPNNVPHDRRLASNRATIATVYIQENSALDGSRILSEGFGQHRPIDDNSTPEGRGHNRRVEIIITGKDLMSGLGSSVEQYYTQREGGTPAPQGADAV
ncbi:MAG: OmpA family protein [Clostridiaceae bacterium]|nr:OmpA family protein [Clostridiaceae bacterium]